jgi:hypothetical protein
MCSAIQPSRRAAADAILTRRRLSLLQGRNGSIPRLDLHLVEELAKVVLVDDRKRIKEIK